MSIYVWNKEIKNLFAWEPAEDYSTMRGPCSEWYHIPRSSEWNGVYNALVALWITSVANFSTYLKLPLAWGRGWSDAVLYSRGTRGYYWCCNIYQNNSGNAVVLSTETWEINIYGAYMYWWNNIRAFKDEAIIPTSSRTKLYWTSIAEWWIFYNSSLWLISVSSNGATWYTIKDKNEWATKVYNYGNTLTESNCWKLFQWWNNYAFSWDQNYNVSSITKSSTKVNITNYWPDNYYNSSTWITVNPWWTGSSSIAYNLWWWETWIIKRQKAAKAVYLWSTKVRPAA